MNKYLLIFISIFLIAKLKAQTPLLINDGGSIVIGSGVLITVEGGLSNSNGGTINAGGDIYVKGDFVNTTTSSFISNTGTIHLNGAAQNITSGGDAFYKLNAEGTGYKKLNDNTIISNSLTLTNTWVNTQTFSLEILPGGTIVRTHPTNNLTNEYIIGFLKKTFNSSSLNNTFEVGLPYIYCPLQISFGTVSNPGVLTATAIDGAHPHQFLSLVHSAKRANMYWNIQNSGLVFNGSSITFNHNGSTNGGNPLNFMVYNISAYTMPSIGNINALSIQALNQTLFGDFCVGENKEEWNWTHSRTFDGNGNVTSESKVYLDDMGREAQSHKSLLSENDVLVSQTIYDAYGRPALRTLPAPSGLASIEFKNNFITDANAIYSFTNFDTPSKLNNPDALYNNATGTLGYYYSNNNSSEPYMTTSGYPYIRTEYTADPAGIPKRAARAGDEFRMGAGHETRTYSMVSGDELKYIFGTNKSYKSYKDNADNLSNSPYTITGGIVAEKTITVDADGKEMISYICNGLPVASCFSGLSAPCAMTTITNTMNYYGTKSTDIHLPASSKATLRLPFPSYVNFLTASATILPSEITYKITDLNTNQLLVQGTDYSINTNGNVAFLGNYLAAYTSARVFRISFDYTNAFLCYITDANGKCYPNTWLSIPDATVTYALDYSQWTLNYYDLAGKLRKSVSPAGINCATPGVITMASTYDYSSKGELIAEKSPDEGKKEFLYDTEGKLRFSQNEVQRAANKMAYTNYDKHGRALESGEYTTNATGVYFQNYYGAYTAPAVCSACTSAAAIASTLDGLIDTQCSDASYIAYYQLPAAMEIPSAYTYKNNYTQKYLLNKVSKTWNSESATWYSYDAFGKNTFTVQQLLDADFIAQNPLVDNQIKTIDYVYDLPTGGLTQQIYQKNNPAEKLTHIFTYDADHRLLTSSIRESADVSDRLQAKYFYYKTGGLKRKELGGDLQGIDYVYTINGELKSMNHPSLDESKDPGKDGYTGSHSAFGKDIFGMSLDYHANDYTHAGSNIVSSGNVATPGFFNGLIQAQRYKTRAMTNGLDNFADYIAYGTGDQVKIINGITDELMNRYTYDELYRLSTSTFGGFNNSTNTFTASLSGNYMEFGASAANGISYDANGNIKTLKRNAYSGVTGLLMDNLTYTYTANTNKLASIVDAATSTYNTDFDAATGKTFSYNALGQMTASQAEGISGIQYNVRKNVKSMSLGTPLALAEYFYNDRGIKQRTKHNTTAAKSTWYVSDVSGNVMAVYEQDLLVSTAIVLKDQPVYGAGRAGVLHKSTGIIEYELSDHLGNVRATFKKISSGVSQLLTRADYYAFGGVMPGRSSGNDYRYNYQGQENALNSRMDNFELRMLNTDLGRWISPDPAGQFASPYISMGNNPVSGVDPDGGYIYDITGDQYNHIYWTNENFVRNAEWQRENLKRDFDSQKISWLEYFEALDVLWRENVGSSLSNFINFKETDYTYHSAYFDDYSRPSFTQRMFDFHSEQHDQAFLGNHWNEARGSYGHWNDQQGKLIWGSNGKTDVFATVAVVSTWITNKNVAHGTNASEAGGIKINWSTVGNSAFYTEQGLKAVGATASSSANAGFKYAYTGMEAAEAAGAKVLGNISKATRVLGHASGVVGAFASGAQFYYSNRSGSDYARLTGAGLIMGANFIPFVGPGISIGLGILDSYGKFEPLYNAFDSQPAIDPRKRR